MDTRERDVLISKLLGEGHTLSEVQKILQKEHEMNMTYMELRLISSEMDIDWKVLDKPVDNGTKEPEINNTDESNPVGMDSLDNHGPGKTVVSVSKVVRPGAVMSGDVKFKSGAKADWHLDPLGRLGLNPSGDSKKPTEEDLKDFQMELQRTIQGSV